MLLPFLTLKTPLRDTLIGLIGASAKALERVFYACATNAEQAWFMYLGEFERTDCKQLDQKPGNRKNMFKNV